MALFGLEDLWASDMNKHNTHYINLLSIYDMYITYEKIGVIYVCRCICIHIHTYVGVEPTKIGWYMGFKQTANVG